MKLGEIQIRTSVRNYARSPVCLQPLGNASMVTDLQELSLGMPLELANFLFCSPGRSSFKPNLLIN